MAKRKQIDRRWIFLLIFLGVALPLIIKVGLPVEITKNVQMVYELVENTPKGSTVLISFDYDPASMPELHPMGLSLLRHCFQRDIKVVFTAMWPMGVQMAEDIVTTLKPDFPKKKYGVDYINLGFKAGGMVTIQSIGKDLKKIFPEDMYGSPITEFPIMQDVNNYNNIAFVFSLSAGAPGIKEWVQIVSDKYNRPTSGGCTGVSAPAILPYVNEQKQLTGLLAGLKAAAEYENLVGKIGSATSGMDAQSIAHLIIISFITIGNINYWRKKNKQKKDRKK